MKGHDSIESDMLTYALVKYYSVGGSLFRPYVHTLIRPYDGIFTPYHIYEHIIICARLLGYSSSIINNGRVPVILPPQLVSVLLYGHIYSVP